MRHCDAALYVWQIAKAHSDLAARSHCFKGRGLCSHDGTLESSLAHEIMGFKHMPEAQTKNSKRKKRMICHYNSRFNSGNSCYRSVHNLSSLRLLPKNVKIRIHKIIILPVALYGCKMWPLIFAKEHRVRVFENRVLRRIFGPKRYEIIQ
jgi:hypothetical protein